MFKNNKVTVEYSLMQKAPKVWGADYDLGARVIERIINVLYPYMVDTEKVRSIIQEKLRDDVKSIIGSYQSCHRVILVQDKGKSQEIKTVELLTKLYDRISALEKENEDLRFLLKQPDIKSTEQWPPS